MTGQEPGAPPPSVWLCLCVCVHECVFVFMCVPLCVCVYVSMRVSLCMCVPLCLCAAVCVSVHHRAPVPLCAPLCVPVPLCLCSCAPASLRHYHCAPPLQVPRGHVWLQGDNLLHSLDSRVYGPVPLALVRGKVMCQVRSGKGFLHGSGGSSSSSISS